MNNEPLFVLLESNPPSMSELLSIRILLKENLKVTIAIVEDETLVPTDKRIEMWLLAFEDKLWKQGNLELLVIPSDFLTNPTFLRKLKERFKRIAVKNKLNYVFFATNGYEMTPLPYVPGYEQFFLANAYRQSVAYRYLENYKR